MMRIFTITIALLLSFSVFAQDVDNFRGFKWDTPFEEMSEGLTPTKSKTPGFKGYEKANENYNYEGITTHTIIYLFKKDKFIGVTMGITNDQVDDAVAMLTKKYGEPRITDTPYLKNYEWIMENAVAVVSYFTTNKDEKSATIGFRKPR
jgi:hypothetical protein